MTVKSDETCRKNIKNNGIIAVVQKGCDEWQFIGQDTIVLALISVKIVCWKSFMNTYLPINDLVVLAEVLESLGKIIETM